MHTATVAGSAARPQGSAPAAEKFLVLPIVILILAQMGTTGDNGALSLAASALTKDLGATTSEIQLANMVYPLVGGAFMIAGGLAGTIIGWKKTFRIGAALCALGEVSLALAPNMAVFIWVGRVLLGFGASFLIPSLLGLIPLMYRGHNRTVAFGCIGAASGLSALLPLILGVVMETAGMHVTFLVLGAYFVGVLALSFELPKIEQQDEKLKFDALGVVLAATGLFLFLIGISSISSWGLIQPLEGCPFTVFGISPALPLAALGLVVLVVLMRVEKDVEQKNGVALLPQSFIHTPQVLAGLVANALTFFFMGVQSILMAPYLQLVAGWSPVDVGVISIVTGVPTFALALGIPKLAPHANPRHVIQTGYVVMAAALGVMALSVTIDGSNAAGVYLGAFLAGVGAGTVSSHSSNVVALAVSERDASQSGGIQSTMRNVGQAIGVALLGAVLLLGITNSVRAGVAADPSISPTVREQVSELTINLGSNEEFEEQIADIPMTQAEHDELVQIEARARYDSTRVAYAVGAGIILLGLLSTPAIKKLS
ncbi:MFS transporter [Thermophilibacter provencensis]|uniref:MFS transporter n=1 Tax=Thermophilibacter provencensis TaxID=1852386 RepID=A0ABT7V5U0_9ACTN|nr:MFS transporter [Thermophilibacter provencensis]MDM8271841.1 MFS transporter [Thermophilibacter provencensis]